MKGKILSNALCLTSLSLPQERHPYEVEVRFLSTDPSNYNGFFPNYSPFLLTFMLCLHLGGACVTLVVHDVQWHTLEVDNISITCGVAFRMEMVQQQEISFLLPWLIAAMWLISYKVPPSSPSCKDFNRVWPWCLHSVPLSV